jgi:hypothetical protein
MSLSSFGIVWLDPMRYRANRPTAVSQVTVPAWNTRPRHQRHERPHYRTRQRWLSLSLMQKVRSSRRPPKL